MSMHAPTDTVVPLEVIQSGSGGGILRRVQGETVRVTLGN